MPRINPGIRRVAPLTRSARPAANAGLTLYLERDAAPSDWVRLVLAEKEVETARVLTLAAGQLHEDLALLNPSLSLPTLVDREGVLVGAQVIAEYLDERYPHPKLMPPAPSERARVRMGLERLMPLVFADTASAEPRQPSVELLQTLFESIPENTRRHGANSWFLGFDYNLIDCAWAALLRGVDLPARTPPEVSRYLQRLRARPAYQRSFPRATD